MKNNKISKIGFNTNGIPKVTVSLILNKPGTKEIVAIVLLSSRLEKIKIQITKPKVKNNKTRKLLKLNKIKRL